MKRFIFFLLSTVISSTANALTISDKLSVELIAGAEKRLDLTPQDKLKKDYFYGLNASYSFNRLLLNTIIIDDRKNGKADDAIKSLSLTYQTAQQNPLTVSAGRIIIPFGVYEVQRVYSTVVSQRTLNDSLWNSIIGSRVIEPSNNGIFIKKDFNNFSFSIAGYTPTSSSTQRFDNITTNIVDPNAANLETVSGTAQNEASNVDSRRNLNRRGNQAVGTVQVLPQTDFSGFLTGDIENATRAERKASSSANKVFLATTYDNRDDLIIDIEKVYSKTDITLNNRTFNYLEEYSYASIQKKIRKFYFVLEAADYRTRSIDGVFLRDRTSAVNVSYDDGDRIVYQVFTSRVGGDTVNITDFSAGLTYSLDYNKHIRVLYRKTEGKYNNQLPRICDSACREIISPDTNFTVGSIPVNASGLEVRAVVYF